MSWDNGPLVDLFVLNRSGRLGRGAYWDGQGKCLFLRILLPCPRPRQSICFQVPAVTQEVRDLPFFRSLNDNREANSENSLGSLLSSRLC